MDSDFKLEVNKHHRNTKSKTGKKIEVVNVNRETGSISKSHYIPLEAVPEYIKALTALLEKETL